MWLPVHLPAALYRRSVLPMPRLPEKRCLGLLVAIRLSLSLARPCVGRGWGWGWGWDWGWGWGWG